MLSIPFASRKDKKGVPEYDQLKNYQTASGRGGWAAAACLAQIGTTILTANNT
jgi:hypothetical protein